MFVGHLAVALGAKSAARRVPLSWLIAASFGIDILWPIFLLLGLEQVVVDPGNTAFTPLDFVSYPWSHSLLAVTGWALLFGFVAYRSGVHKKGAILVGGLVVSHWVLDWITHRPDLPLWPGGMSTGLGLWNSVPATFAVEGTMIVVAVYLFLRTFKLNGMRGKMALFSLLTLVVVIWASGPFSPPPPGPNAIALVGLSMILLPIWGWWIDRNTSSDYHAA